MARGGRAMRGPETMALAAAACLFGLIGTGSPAAAATPAAAAVVEETDQPASAMVTAMAAWVRASHDNGGRPFIIVDKTAAEVFVYGPEGDLRGRTPALLGLATGDDSTPGIGDREVASLPPEERTTPAGRFVAGFGRAAGGGNVFWVDYATAISLHPVVTTHPRERRLERLHSPAPDDHRITHGCINVSAAFFRDVVQETFQSTTGVVYILPDTKPLGEVFPTFSIHTGLEPPPLRDRADGLAAPVASAGSDGATVR